MNRASLLGPVLAGLALVGCGESEPESVEELQGIESSAQGRDADEATRPPISDVERAAPPVEIEKKPETPEIPETGPPSEAQRIAGMLGTWFPLTLGRIDQNAEQWTFRTGGAVSRSLAPDGGEQAGSYRYDDGADLIVATLAEGRPEQRICRWQPGEGGRASIVQVLLGETQNLELRPQSQFVLRGSAAWKEHAGRGAIIPPGGLSLDPTALTPGAHYVIARATPLRDHAELRSDSPPGASIPADATIRIVRQIEKGGRPWYRVQVIAPAEHSAEGWVSSADLADQELELAR